METNTWATNINPSPPVPSTGLRKSKSQFVKKTTTLSLVVRNTVTKEFMAMLMSLIFILKNTYLCKNKFESLFDSDFISPLKP